MSNQITIVIGATHQEWAGRLTGWITDHGGDARLRDHYVFTREDAFGQEYDCLVTDADSSLLDSAFVHELHRRGRTVVAVNDPALPHLRARLEELGVDRVVDRTVTPKEMLGIISEVATTRQDFNAVVHGLGDPDRPTGTGLPVGGLLTETEAVQSCLTVVTGAVEGEGATEVTVEMAVALRERGESVVVVDADLVAPSLAQRLRVPFDRNLNTAVDAVVHHSGYVSDALTPTPTGGFEVLAGFEHPKKWTDLDAEDLLAVLDELRLMRRHVLVNVGSSLENLPCDRHAVARATVAAADRVVVVADASPTGIERLTRWLVDAAELTGLERIHVAFNRCRSRDAEQQLEFELLRNAPVAGTTGLPADPKVHTAGWAGDVVAPGRFTKAVARLVDDALPRTFEARRRCRPIGRAKARS